MLKLLGIGGGGGGGGTSAAASAAAAAAASSALTTTAAAAGASGQPQQLQLPSEDVVACAARSAATSPTNSHGSSGEEVEQPEQAPPGQKERSASTGSTGSGGGGGGGGGMTLAAAMAEIEARFLLNLPEEELASVERLFFQLEQAHWYYEDFLADAHPDALPHYGLEGFTAALFTHSDCLRHLQEAHADLIKAFNSYKYAVPVYGCVLLTPAMDKLLLVCNWEGTAWGLPRGKVNEGETPMDCAAREVLEETGYDVAGQLREEDAFTMVQNAKRMTMYIVRDVPEDFPFEPRVRKEVSQVKFWPLDRLPQRSYNVVHSVAHVRHWMGRLAKREQQQQKQRQQQAQGQGQGGGKRDASNGRAGSRGKKGQGQGQGQGQQGSLNRAQSAPGGRARSSGRQQPRREDPYDANNAETFGGQPGAADWGVEQMFRANESLTGRKFTYDGNPQRFGEYVGGGEAQQQQQQQQQQAAAPPRPRPSPPKQRRAGHEKPPQDGGEQQRGRAATVPAVRSLHEIEASLQAPPAAAPKPKTTKPHQPKQQQQQQQQQQLPPAVASFLGAANSTAAATTAPPAAPVVVLSCASLEQQPEQPEPSQLAAAPAAMGDFTFDTKDILSALQF